jgi:hypothetical protein
VQLSVGGGTKDWYGNGADGPLVIPAGTTTLTRDMFYTTLVVNAGATLETAGFRVFAETSIVNNGTIQFTPGDAPGSAGGVAPSGSLPRSRDGAGGANAAPGTGGNTMFPGTAGSGGASGQGNTGAGGSPGGASTVIAPTHGGMDVVLFGITWHPLDQNNTTPLSWGGSGAGGGVGVPTGTGGGGGSGGGIMVLASPTITGTGVVLCRGGNGAQGGAANPGGAGGGGGGGQGGVIALITDSGASPIATAVPGGAGGAAGNNGAGAVGTPGTAGTAGVVRQYKAGT